MQQRKIIHIDMDAFFASVEQRDNPALRGKPIAVGGGSDRGVVCAASYEARTYGVRAAMPGKKAQELCPQIIFVPVRFEAYKEVSATIRKIFHEYTDLVEPLSLDEAYLDVTQNHQSIPYAVQIAKEIRAKIYEETGLTASAGVSYNKFLAKTASDINKPDGLTVIRPEEAIPFLEDLKIEKFFGIGKVTAAKMHALNIYKGGDLKKLSEHELHKRFGKAGIHYYHIVRGRDDRNVNPDCTRKSISVEHTFKRDIKDKEHIQEALSTLAKSLQERMKKAKTSGTTFTLKFKFSDFKSITRSLSVDQPITDQQEIKRLSIHLLGKVEMQKPVRLLGLGISNLTEGEEGMQNAQLHFNL